MAVPRLKFFAVACEEQASSGGAAIVLVETSFMSKVGLGIRTQLDNEHNPGTYTFSLYRHIFQAVVL